MRAKIQAIRRKEMPSSFGGKPWNITSVKFDGIENPQYGYDLAGFGTKADKFQAGDVISGYISTKVYTKKDGTQGSNQVFNAITPEYVYDLILKMNPEIENIQAKESVAATIPNLGAKDGWATGGAPAYTVEEIDPNDIPF
jgi:hypothetical protein